MLRTVSGLSAAFDAAVGESGEFVEVAAGGGAGGGVLKSVAIPGGAVGTSGFLGFGAPCLNWTLIGEEGMG